MNSHKKNTFKQVNHKKIANSLESDNTAASEIDIEVKGYDYYTMMKAGLKWVPVFAVVILICASFSKMRFFLFLTVGAATYGVILNQLKKKFIVVRFLNEFILLSNETIQWSDIESYHTCLPLREFFMVRLRMKDGRKFVTYIDKEHREEVEQYLKLTAIPATKTGNDTWLKYSHSSFLYYALFICIIIDVIIEHIKY